MQETFEEESRKGVTSKEQGFHFNNYQGRRGDLHMGQVSLVWSQVRMHWLWNTCSQCVLIDTVLTASRQIGHSASYFVKSLI